MTYLYVRHKTAGYRKLYDIFNSYALAQEEAGLRKLETQKMQLWRI